MQINLSFVKQYIRENNTRKPPERRHYGFEIYNRSAPRVLCNDYCESGFSIKGKRDLDKEFEFHLTSTWQECLFEIIDKRKLDEVEVYKNSGISRQTFSKIRCDSRYHPDKDTAICFCFGLKLTLDESLDLLAKAGYTLSTAIRRELVVRYFLEHEIYDLMSLDHTLNELHLKLIMKY